MEHFIVMVFNLQHNGKPITYEGNPCWLENRLAIFKKYCINAFANQTDPNFHLLVYCDNTTPNPYRNELLELESKYNFIKICWDFTKRGDADNLKSNFKSSILNQIKKIVPPNTKEVICSRFENDDIPEVRYNEFVKISHQQYDIISLAKGLYWDITTDQFLDSTFPTGPFISVKSNLDNFISPLEEEHHNYITKRGGKPIITEENLWIQLIHGDNLWNRMDRMPGNLISPPTAEYLKTYFSHE
jgi:hypothetical protein